MRAGLQTRIARVLIVSDFCPLSARSTLSSVDAWCFNGLQSARIDVVFNPSRCTPRVLRCCYQLLTLLSLLWWLWCHVCVRVDVGSHMWSTHRASDKWTGDAAPAVVMYELVRHCCICRSLWVSMRTECVCPAFGQVPCLHTFG